jgi:ABC-type nitrate/sulfonate/bicarbonate transport system substrate-binding protein
VFALVHAAIGKRIMTGGWFTTADWLKANTAVAKRFVAAIYETARWANANHAATGAILLKYAKIEPAVVAKMTRTTFATSLTPDLLDSTLDWAARVKFTDRRVMPSEMIATL